MAMIFFNLLTYGDGLLHGMSMALISFTSGCTIEVGLTGLHESVIFA